MPHESPRVAILGYVWPEVTSSAAGFRDENLIDFFLTNNYEIHVLSAAKENEFSKSLNARGISTHTIQLNHSSFEHLVQKLDLDLIIFDRYITEEQYGARVEKASPRTIRILDTQDLHCLRHFREKKIRVNSSLFPESSAINIARELSTTDEFLREISSLYRVDLSLILSTFELDLLSSLEIPSDRFFYLPFAYPPPTKQSKSWEERKNFCFIGNYRHPPNHDGIFWFCRDLWPAILARTPEAKLHLYGAYPPQEIMNLNNASIVVHGPVQNHLEALARYRVNIAPLRFGAGIKGKITDGWWAGTPCISTPIGAEGLGNPAEWGGIVANSVNEFIESCSQLYTNESHWITAQTNAYRILANQFSRQQIFKNFATKILELREHYETKRKQNYLGNMLRYHQYRSTEYFSRWLEEKCKSTRNSC